MWEYKKATDVAIDYYVMCNVQHPHVLPRGVPSVVLSPPLACDAPLTDRCGFDVGLGSLVDVCESGTAHEQPPGVTPGEAVGIHPSHADPATQDAGVEDSMTSNADASMLSYYNEEIF